MAISIVPLERPGDAVEYVRDLLARCESGEVVSVTALEERRGGAYSLGGSSTASRIQTAGMLLHLAIARLGDED